MTDVHLDIIAGFIWEPREKFRAAVLRTWLSGFGCRGDVATPRAATTMSDRRARLESVPNSGETKQCM